MMTLYWTLFAIMIIMFVVSMVGVILLFNNINKIMVELKELNKINMDIAMLKGHINAINQEIDFHLHTGDELANSYFSTCKELRQNRGFPYNYKYDVWMGK